VQGSSIETVANTYAEETSNEKQLLVLRTLKLTTYLLLDPTPWPTPTMDVLKKILIEMY